MPKTNLCKPRVDPRSNETKALILAGMARKDMPRKKLAEKVNLPISTFNDRMRNPENMRLGELWLILDALSTSEEDKRKIV